MSNYGTNVSFSVPVYQRPAIRTQEKPEINVETIDVSKFVRGFAEGIEKRQEAEQEQQMEAVKSRYATERDQIQIAVGQGAMTADDADIALRELSAKYRGQFGLSVEDDMKIKKGFGESVAGLAKTRQEMIVKEEEKVREATRERLRNASPFLRDADNNTVDSFKYYTDMLGKSQEEARAIIDNPYTSTAERAAAQRRLEDSTQANAYMEVQRIVLDEMKRNVTNSKQIDINFKQKVLDDTREQLVARGFTSTGAVLAAENIWNTSGYSQWERTNQIDRDTATKEFENKAANYEAALKAGGLEQEYKVIQQNPEWQFMHTLNPKVIERMDAPILNQYTDLFATFKAEAKGGQLDAKKVRTHVDNATTVSAIQSSNVALGTNNSNRGKIGTIGAATTAIENSAFMVDPKTATTRELEIAVKNVTEATNRLFTPVAEQVIAKGKNSKLPDEREEAALIERKREGLNDKKNAMTFALYAEGPAKQLLADNANRMRTDSQGNVVLTGNRSWWQAVTDQFTNLEHTVESINKGASMLSPDERKRMFQQLGVKPLQAGETATDLSGLNVAKAATGLAQGAENLVKRATGPQPRLFGDKEPQTFNQTSEQLQQQLDARMTADKVDVFTKNPKDPNTPVFNPPVIERTKELVNKSDKVRKVIEKSSAELMKDVDKLMKNRFGDTDSIQLRQQLGVKFKEFQDAMNEALKIADLKYQLEKTYQEEAELYKTFDNVDKKYDIQRAMYSAEELDRIESAPFTGEETTTTTSKVSNKSTLGGAQIAVDGLQDTIAEVSNKHNIDPELMSLIVQRESANGKYTLSPKGARGYAQIMPKTWNEEVAPALGFTPEDIDDPVKNMEGGAWYMSKMMKVARRKFPKADEREIVDIAAAYYNWGQGNVGEAMQEYGDNWLKHAPKETKNYVQFLRDTYKREDEMMDGGPVGQDLNAWALLAALEDYIDYDRLPEDLKKKVKDPSTKPIREYYYK